MHLLEGIASKKELIEAAKCETAMKHAWFYAETRGVMILEFNIFSYSFHIFFMFIELL